MRPEEFIVGQTIVNNVTEHTKERGVKQIITSVDKYEVVTDLFLNRNDHFNKFILSSEYAEQCKSVTTSSINTMTKYKNLTISREDLVKIHSIACTSWQAKILEYGKRIDLLTNNITFTEQEVDEMFKAAINDQRIALVDIFGHEKHEIDFDKIKTGSQVMIKTTGELIGSIRHINLSEPVNVVLYKTLSFINHDKFHRHGGYNQHITFEQNGKFVAFAANTNTDYITEVIEY